MSRRERARRKMRRVEREEKPPGAGEDWTCFQGPWVHVTWSRAPGPRLTSGRSYSPLGTATHRTCCLHLTIPAAGPGPCPSVRPTEPRLYSRADRVDQRSERSPRQARPFQLLPAPSPHRQHRRPPQAQGSASARPHCNHAE